MKEIEINVQEPYLSFILNGTKTVEGRLNKGKFKELEIGDILSIAENKFLVKNKNTYKSFKEMIEMERIENVIPDKTSINDGVAVYYKFFTKEQEREFGVVAIKIEKIA